MDLGACKVSFKAARDHMKFGTNSLLSDDIQTSETAQRLCTRGLKRFTNISTGNWNPFTSRSKQFYEVFDKAASDDHST